MSRALPKLDNVTLLEGFRWTGPEAEHVQVGRLYAVMEAAAAATPQARQGMLFASYDGLHLLMAMYRLTDCDELSELIDQVSAEIGDPEWREKL